MIVIGTTKHGDRLVTGTDVGRNHCAQFFKRTSGSVPVRHFSEPFGILHRFDGKGIPFIQERPAGDLA